MSTKYQVKIRKEEDTIGAVPNMRKEEGECETSRVMPNMPGHPRPEWGQGHSEWDEEESRKPDPSWDPSRVRHTSPQIFGDNQEENKGEEEEEEEDEVERQHIEHNVEARVVVQLDKSDFTLDRVTVGVCMCATEIFLAVFVTVVCKHQQNSDDLSQSRR